MLEYPRFDQPMPPPFLESMDLRHLRLGDASADVRLHRFGGEVAATVTERHGDLRIVITH